MITGRQVRAARALLNWTQEMLAEKALVALTALKRLESERGLPVHEAVRVNGVAARKRRFLNENSTRCSRRESPKSDIPQPKSPVFSVGSDFFRTQSP